MGSLRFTILGCSSSGGVPRIGNNWGACDPAEPKNRRRRCSLLVRRTEDKSHGAGEEGRSEETRVLIDTSPDLREQLLDTGVGELDGVLYTHEHADHIHGIDDLRAVYFNMRRHVPVYANDRTANILVNRFGYCFYTPPGSAYPPILDLNRIEKGVPVSIDGAGGTITALPFELEHGHFHSLGFRIGGLAYTPDLNGVPDHSVQFLEGLDVWIIDALRAGKPHPTHFTLEEALAWIERMKPKRAILTNMHVDMDYRTLVESLPSGVEPAYDGLEIEIATQDT